MSLVSLAHDSISSILKRNSPALLWGLPEQWIHAELFAEFLLRSDGSGWTPIPEEVPYLTYLPVSPPKNRDWRNDGAMKWIDLCLYSPDRSNWVWLELKVRHAGLIDRRNKAERDALDATKKDVVALMGFNVPGTANAWSEPDNDTKIHWADRLLKPHASSIREGRHHFMALYLQLDDKPNFEIWNPQSITNSVTSWFDRRKADSCAENFYPIIEIDSFQIQAERLHSLTSIAWSQ